MTDAYQDFLRAKAALAAPAGFEVDPAKLSPLLKPHQRVMVQWAVRGGRRALFASFGLGKTVIQLEAVRLTRAHAGGRGLIVLPLGVRQEFTRDAAMLDVPVTFIRRLEEAQDPDGIYLTNYETVRDGKLDPTAFSVISLDEASALRGFGGTKTFRAFMRYFEGTSRYRFVATATPSPNEFIELLAYAAFLDVMDVGQAKAQPLDAKVLTPTGWTTMGDLRPGDQVIAGDGSPTRVLGLFPQGERPVYRVTFSDGASTECDGDHLWLTRTQYERNNECRRRQRGRHDGCASVKTTAQIAGSLRSRDGTNHSIPLVGPVAFAARPVTIDPWLLGVLLGDGYLRRYNALFSSADDWIVKQVEARIPAGLAVRRIDPLKCDYIIANPGGRGTRNVLVQRLRAYGLTGKRAHEKRIPPDYLVNSVEVRLACLRGLMDTDGTVDSGGCQQSLTTVSSGLAEDVQALVRSLGGIATIRSFPTTGRVAYKVLVALPRDLNPFALPRKAARVRPKTKYPPRRFIVGVESIGTKPAQCLAVEHPGRLYVTDDFVVTHNTRFFQRDSEHADALTLRPHKEREFWLWVASWALFVSAPSDLGFSDEGYALPPMTVTWHEIPSDHAAAGAERDGQARMFRSAAYSVTEASREKRDSLPARLDRVMEIVHGQRGATEIPEGLLRAAQGVAPCEGAGEGQAQISAEPGGVQGSGSEMAGGQSGTDARASTGTLGAESRGDTGPEPAVVRRQQGPGPDASQDQEAASLRTDAGRVPGHSRCSGRGLRDLHEERSRGDNARGPLPPDGSGARHPLPSLQYSPGPVRGRFGPPHGSSGLSDQLVIWCDLNDEQRRLERALHAKGISVSSLYGGQDVEYRELLLEAWRAGATSAFLSKPSMYGAGVNLQQSHTMIFIGIGFKFSELIQAIHRIHRFLQAHPCQIHLIYTEAERPIRQVLEAKWARHAEQAEIMRRIIREYGLAEAALASALSRSIGVTRQEATGEGYRLINADAVEETRQLAADSVDLLVTSIPFATQYEYTPSYNDFGHTDDNAHFWAQMDFLTPELLRVLRPGRVAVIHVKDRIVPGGLTGLGFQTVSAFHAEAIFHYQRHGFAFLGMKTVVTDVVRENNQTYRLGWTEQCKDGSRMGAGMPEYLLLFRKPPTDRSNGYADVPVVKAKKLWTAEGWDHADGYSRARWQLDAHGFTRSSGNRLLAPDDLVGVKADVVYKLFRAHSLGTVYDFAHHVACGEALEAARSLPPTFMLLPPQSWHPDVWTDVARMRTLNMTQAQQGREMHLCPLQFDIVDRLIEQFSMPGELVFDPFAGLMTVPYCAIRLKRRGLGIELSPTYFRDGARYVEAAARELASPSLFDLIEALPPTADEAAD